jgi:glycerol-3-phosphate dehydrogenase (NAD(P)+)
MRVTILGAGSWGTTLALLLHSNRHQVVLWAHRQEHARALLESHENVRLLPGIKIPPALTVTSDLASAVHGCEMVVTAVPTQFLRSVTSQLRSVDFSDVTVVNVAKGIENDSLMLISDILLDVLPTIKGKKIVALSGPSFADEVSRKIPTAVVAASSNLEAARLAQSVFMTPYFRVYSSEDIRGVELAGAVKNVIAIGAGIADGAGFGDNTKAAVMTRATAEISRLGHVFGAKPQTFAGLSGIGDLIATCVSRHSRNRHVGEEIGKGRKLNDVLRGMVMVAEGVATTKSVHDLSEKHNIDLPISNAVYEILFDDKDPVLATSDLMTREPKGEH